MIMIAANLLSLSWCSCKLCIIYTSIGFLYEKVCLSQFYSLHYSLGISKHEFMTPGHFHFTDEDSEGQ